jgi:hypothetical protein
MRVRTIVLLSAVALLATAPAEAHKGSPNYRSTVRFVDPPVRGLKVRVLNYDDRLELRNGTGRAVEVRGYAGEPYARLLSDGTVEVNKRSPSYYLNVDRFGDGQVPADARNSATPRWEVIDKTGRFEWHDHRIHYMSKSLPNQVTDRKKRTKIFDWTIPVVVGGEPVRLRGDLYWVPTAAGGVPRGALVALAAIVIAAICFVEVVRRRRRREHPGSRKREAWG